MIRMPLTEFRKFMLKTTKELRESRCVEVLSDGSHLGFFVIGASPEGMQQQIVSRCGLIEAGRVYASEVESAVQVNEGDSGGEHQAEEGPALEEDGAGDSEAPLPEGAAN